MSTLIYICFKLFFLILHCTARDDPEEHSKLDELWNKSDYRTSEEKDTLSWSRSKPTDDNLSYKFLEESIGAKYDTIKVRKLNEKLNSKQLTEEQIETFKLWPNATIPYYIDLFSYDKVISDQIRDHLNHVNTLSPLHFEELPEPPKDENKRWVLFVNRRGQLNCKDYSTNSFTNTGVQKVIIGYDCLQTPGPIDAIVLALAGVPPQHNSPNRDSFITVSMESILPEKRGLFKVLNNDEWLFNMPYDMYSAGHYHSYKYTADGSATIKTLPEVHSRKTNKSSNTIPENTRLSIVDIGKLIILYKNRNYQLNMNKEKCKTRLGMQGRDMSQKGVILSDLDYTDEN